MNEIYIICKLVKYGKTRFNCRGLIWWRLQRVKMLNIVVRLNALSERFLKNLDLLSLRGVK